LDIDGVAMHFRNDRIAAADGEEGRHREERRQRDQ
jgi:hypothetical protein